MLLCGAWCNPTVLVVRCDASRRGAEDGDGQEPSGAEYSAGAAKNQDATLMSQSIEKSYEAQSAQWSIRVIRHVKEKLQVMAYELMWTPNCTSQGAKEGETLTRKVYLTCVLQSECTRAGTDLGAVLYWIHEDMHTSMCENLCVYTVYIYTHAFIQALRTRNCRWLATLATFQSW